jgi:hypothetical protein
MNTKKDFNEDIERTRWFFRFIVAMIKQALGFD